MDSNDVRTIYYGVFFDKENLGDKANDLLGDSREELDTVINNPHITFAFGQEMTDNYKELLGKDLEVNIIGYGNDGKNEGFEVSLNNKEEFKNKVPHITISIADGAKAVDTGKLEFDKLDTSKDTTLKGKYGWFGSDGKVHFEEQLKERETTKLDQFDMDKYLNDCQNKNETRHLKM